MDSSSKSFNLPPLNSQHAASVVTWGNNYLEMPNKRLYIHTNVPRRLNSSHPSKSVSSQLYSSSSFNKVHSGTKPFIKNRRRHIHSEVYHPPSSKFQRVLIFCIETTVLFTIAVFLSNLARERNVQSGVVVDLLVGTTFILFFEDIFKIIKEIAESTSNALQGEDSDSESDSETNSDNDDDDDDDDNNKNS